MSSKNFTKEDVREVIKKLELVQNISSPEWLKVSGTEIVFASCKDEFTGHIIRMIPDLYRFLKLCVNIKRSEDFEEVREDIKSFLELNEAILAKYLEESDCNKLVGDQK